MGHTMSARKRGDEESRSGTPAPQLRFPMTAMAGTSVPTAAVANRRGVHAGTPLGLNMAEPL